MGLDMYLRAEKYVSDYQFSDPESREMYAALVAAASAERIVDPETPSATITVTAAYWRKANAIHQWFVDNVQGGEDECRPHSVSREQLRALRNACQHVLDSVKTAPGKVSVGRTMHSEGGEIVAEDILRDGDVVVNPEIAQEHLPTASGFFFGSTDYDEGYVYDLRSTVTQLDRALAAPEEWTFEYQSSW